MTRHIIKPIMKNLDRNSAKVVRAITIFSLSLFFIGCSEEKPIFKSKEFAWYPTYIEQDVYKATALSDTLIVSDYQSVQSSAPCRLLEFKFSINGKDNETVSGVNHKFTCTTAKNETPVIVFGEQLDMSGSDVDNKPMDVNTELTLKVDLSHVFQSFDSVGYYVTSTGYKIFKQDFKGIWIAGGVAPLQWDFDNLMGRDDLKLSDTDNDHIYEVTLIFNRPQEVKNRVWSLKNDISSYPQYIAPTVMENAIYNMALDEMINAVETDGTLRTGAEWAGVWTRDVSYSIILSMAYMQPEVSKNSLLRKVNSRMRIIQDTGTGGAWPCSTDRMIWAVAAWEIYLVTGDIEWLKFVYPIICNSIEDDRLVAFNKEYGLMMGESSFIDWRDQSYPKWMQPVDIYQSICLGTNAVHYKSLTVAARIAEILNDSVTAQKYSVWAENIKININKYLYLEDEGYYATYLYGRNNYQQEQRSESLGEALAILWDIAPAEQQQNISKRMPFTKYGAPIFYPFIKNVPAYHNNAVWPFVSSYCGLAYSKTKNMQGVLNSFATINRAAALFCTNKENIEATTGDYKLTQVNSDNMLWSLSGNIAMTHKVLFGIKYTEEGLVFNPVVPSSMNNVRQLKNFKYRNAILNITIEGYGSEIKSFLIDNVESENLISTSTTGEHDVKILLTSSSHEISKINIVESAFTPLYVQDLKVHNDTLLWNGHSDIKEYYVYVNGKEVKTIKNNRNSKVHKYTLDPNVIGDIQIRSCDKDNNISFASEPIRKYSSVSLYEFEDYETKSTFKSSGFEGTGFVEVNTNSNEITLSIEVEKDGKYAIDVRYANGNGPINTDNKCAIRSLNIDDVYIGSMVLPQRGTLEWSNWGWSNKLAVDLKQGTHQVKIVYNRHNFNMNIKNNFALLDQLRVTCLD